MAGVTVGVTATDGVPVPVAGVPPALTADVLVAVGDAFGVLLAAAVAVAVALAVGVDVEVGGPLVGSDVGGRLPSVA